MSSMISNIIGWHSGSRAKPPAQNDLCEVCGKRPKYVENGHKHPYCGRTCARNGQGPSITSCLLHGCRATGKPAFGNFCSDVHAREGVRLGYVQGCDICHVQPRTIGNICIPCNQAPPPGPALRELFSNSKEFKTVRSEFLSAWESEQPRPSVDKIYEIILSHGIRSRHDGYRAANHIAEDMRAFHSAQCICDLGTKGPVLCHFKSCGICCIAKSGFRALAFDAEFNIGRFGDGIYSYQNSALADRFATSCTSSPYRVTIACDVATQSMDEPGGSDDSSLFVPVSDAILPLYIIMYLT